jgi:DNA modification methylase
MSCLIEPKSIHTCVTSPPYFGLRDYGHDGQIGLEPTPDEFVAAMVEVFRHVRECLRDDGTVWLNLGDSYAQAGGRGEQGSTSQRMGRANVAAQERRAISTRPPEGLKAKDLIGIPWRVAFALQADGWYLRQDIIWHKPNPMPESVRDRCTKSHEYIFLFSKQPKYYFNHEAIKEPVASSTKSRLSQKTLATQAGSDRVPGKTNGPMKAVGGMETRSRRSVWSVPTKPFKGAHFATFPPDLIEPCVLAGCPEGGTVLDPFGGAGTTALVANRHGRNAVLCELNPEYAQMACDRLECLP